MGEVVDAVVARRKPYYCELEAGRTYLWCSCGRSRSQPFCDGSHKGTPFRPVRYTAVSEGEEVLFCGCKRCAIQPFCDGAHNDLSATDDLDDPDSAANRAIPVIAAGADGKAMLDGGCYVCTSAASTLARRGALAHRRIVGRADGALHQSVFHLACDLGPSPVLGFGDRQVILFIAGGTGEVAVGDRRFPVGPNTGLHVRPEEAFQLVNTGTRPLEVFAAASPLADDITWHDRMPGRFDGGFPTRTVGLDADARRSMGDRFFQMLVDKTMGSTAITQFVGEIPRSKAAPHRHLYEESLVVMSGSGYMWTETRKAPVRAGDVIFLPRKQVHSLECTDPAGMLVAGIICPGDNPSISY